MNEIICRDTTPFLIMGIVNVTPDSFSDGGRYTDPCQAYDLALSHVEQGADIVDIGAESSQPGASPVSVSEEWRRLQPVLTKLSTSPLPVPVSVDTWKPEIMTRLLDFPVAMINDTRCRVPSSLLQRLAARGMSYLAMHMHRGDPRTMQDNPLTAEEVMPALGHFFRAQVSLLRKCGFSSEKIWIDPGIGFGKSDKAAMRVFTKLQELTHIAAVAIGVSRKSWIGRNFAIDATQERGKVGNMLELALFFQGAKLLRTHEVANLHNLRRLL